MLGNVSQMSTDKRELANNLNIYLNIVTSNTTMDTIVELLKRKPIPFAFDI